MKNPHDAPVGSEVVLSPTSRHPEKVTILDRTENDYNDNCCIRVEHENGLKFTHEIRPDGSVAYWNRNDE